METLDENTKLMEAMQHFYKLKNQYESKLEKQKHKIIRNKIMTKKEKRKKLQEIKPKCEKCGRNVGMEFNMTRDKLKVICGDSVKPCKLNIDINRGNGSSLDESYLLILEALNEEKTNLIRSKMDLFYGYSDEETTLKYFEEFKENYSQANTLLDKYLKKREDLLNSDVKKSAIIELKRSLFISNENINKLIVEYEQQKDNKLLSNVIEIYLKEIVPIADKLRNETYNYNAVEYNDDIDEYKLIQKQHSVDELEDTEFFGNKPELVKFKK